MTETISPLYSEIEDLLFRLSNLVGQMSRYIIEDYFDDEFVEFYNEYILEPAYELKKVNVNIIRLYSSKIHTEVSEISSSVISFNEMMKNVEVQEKNQWVLNLARNVWNNNFPKIMKRLSKLENILLHTVPITSKINNNIAHCVLTII